MFNVGDKVVRKPEYRSRTWEDSVNKFLNSGSVDTILTVKKIMHDTDLYFEEDKGVNLCWDVYRFELYKEDTSIDDWL